MRIRKRHALLSSSHFPATAPSDPHPNIPSQGLVQLSTAATTATDPSLPLSVHHREQRGSSRVLSSDRGGQPSDQPVSPIKGWDESGAHRQHIKQDPSVEEDNDDDYGRRDASGEDEEEDKKSSNDSRKGSIFGSSQTLPPPLKLYSSSPTATPQDDERWCEEEKAIPFKKRRGSFDNINDDHANNNKTKAKMKTKMNNKCGGNNSEEEEEKEKEKEKVKVKVKGKKKGRGSAVMEGSRCSRVNGRGWRCCQQTLVGYSLCEHHLGKGRLRSMTSVRNRSSSTTTTAPTTNTKVVVQHHDHRSNKPDNKEEEEEEKRRKMIMGGGGSSKRKMKQLGMVKARSINSLLGQTTNTPIALVAAHDAVTTNK